MMREGGWGQYIAMGDSYLVGGEKQTEHQKVRE